MFKWGVARELVPVDVFQAISTVAGLRKSKTKARDLARVLPVDDDVVDRTVKQIPYETTKDMIRFQRLTGCRPGELFILRPQDIDILDKWSFDSRILFRQGDSPVGENGPNDFDHTSSTVDHRPVDAILTLNSQEIEDDVEEDEDSDEDGDDGSRMDRLEERMDRIERLLEALVRDRER